MTVWNYILKQSSLPVYFLRPQLEASSAGRHPHHSSAITLHSFISVVSVFIQFKDKNVVNEIIKEIKNSAVYYYRSYNLQETSLL